MAIAGFIAATAIAAGGLAWYGVRDGYVKEGGEWVPRGVPG